MMEKDILKILRSDGVPLSKKAEFSSKWLLMAEAGVISVWS